MRILIAGPNPAVRCQENVAFLGTATGENLQKIIEATKLKPHIFAYDNLYPHPTPSNAPLTKTQMEVAATHGAYFLATYDGVIVLGQQAKMIMKQAEMMYGLGEWTAIPHPSPRNLQTNNKEFINDCAQAINSFVFRVFTSFEQSGRSLREEPQHEEFCPVAYGNFGSRK